MDEVCGSGKQSLMVGMGCILRDSRQNLSLQNLTLLHIYTSSILDPLLNHPFWHQMCEKCMDGYALTGQWVVEDGSPTCTWSPKFTKTCAKK